MLIFKPLLYLLSFKRRFPYGKYPNKVNSALEQKNINELIEKLKRK